MELFNLLAKLTLDKSEYDKALNEAQSDADSIDLDEPKLGIDNEEFNRGIEDSQNIGDTFGESMGAVFSGIKSALVASGVVMAISSIVSNLREAVNMTAETADGIDKGSAKLGISRKAYQEWDHALKQSGASIDVVKKGIMQFQAAIKDSNDTKSFKQTADGIKEVEDESASLSKDAKEALTTLGLLGEGATQSFDSAEEMMNAALIKLAEFTEKGGSVEERGVLVRQLFGRGGDELNDLLDEGSEGVKALLSEASDLGLIMSDQEIDNAVAYGDAVQNLHAELDAIKQAFVADIIPVLKSATEWLTDFISNLNPRLQTSSIYSVFEQINKKTIAASQQVDEATVEAGDLIKKLQEMGDYWTLDDEGKMTWDALASRALDLFPKLSKYIDSDGKKINGNTQEILRNIEAWSTLEKQRLLSNAMAEKEAAVADKLTEAYEKGAEARKKESEAEGKRGTAIKELNKYLSEDSQLSDNASFAEFQKARTELLNTINPDTDLALFNEVSKIGSEWSGTAMEAENLRKEAEKLKEEANNAKSELADEQKYLMEEMGYTQEEIDATISRLEELGAKINSLPAKKRIILEMYQEKANGHAIGSAYIPYDNYPALLHRGEKVLTATEVRKQENNSNNVDMNALSNGIVESIRDGMKGAQVNSYMDSVKVNRKTNNVTGKTLMSRRFAPT